MLINTHKAVFHYRWKANNRIVKVWGDNLVCLTLCEVTEGENKQTKNLSAAVILFLFRFLDIYVFNETQVQPADCKYSM